VLVDQEVDDFLPKSFSSLKTHCTLLKL